MAPKLQLPKPKVKVHWFKKPRPFFVSGHMEPLCDSVGEVSINDKKVISIFMDSKFSPEDAYEDEAHLDGEIDPSVAATRPMELEYYAKLDTQGFESMVGTSDTKEGIEEVATTAAQKFWNLVKGLVSNAELPTPKHDPARDSLNQGRRFSDKERTRPLYKTDPD